MVYLRKTLPEHCVDTGIFSRIDDNIDAALLNTGIADDREGIRVIRCLLPDKGGLGMPLLDGHRGQRHHLVTSMRTKEFLKLYYSYLVHDHQLLFNSKDLDVDGTPPDDLVDYIHRLRLREPEEAPLIIFAKACRKQSDGMDSSSATDFHQRLVDAERLEETRNSSAFRVLNSHSPRIRVAPELTLKPKSLTRNTSPRRARTCSHRSVDV